MMKKIIFLMIISLFLTSCFSQKTIENKENNSLETEKNEIISVWENEDFEKEDEKQNFEETAEEEKNIFQDKSEEKTVKIDEEKFDEAVKKLEDEIKESFDNIFNIEQNLWKNSENEMVKIEKDLSLEIDNFIKELENITIHSN